MIYFQDPQFTQYLGDVRDVLNEIPEHSVDCIITSPPYWGLRSYKAPTSIWLLKPEDKNCQHEWGNGERWLHRGTTKSSKLTDGTITSCQTTGGFCLKCGAWQGVLGSEPDIKMYIRHLCDIFTQCKRVLKPTGSLWCNLDDSFAANRSYQIDGTKQVDGSQPEGKPIQARNIGIPAKSLCAIPERFVVEMLESGWIYRETIIWKKDSCMPESVRDRCTRDFEYLYHFVLKDKYFFERQFEAASEPIHTENYRVSKEPIGESDLERGYALKKGGFNEYCAEHGHYYNGKRNLRSVWVINPEPQPAAKKKDEVRHYAAFPTKLCATPILACVPEQICTKCGLPRTKIYEENKVFSWKGDRERVNDLQWQNQSKHRLNADIEIKEVGLSDCGCGAKFVSGVVLDIFAGTGTVAVEARRLGRKSILVDISPEYCEIAKKRLEAIALPLGMVEK